MEHIIFHCILNHLNRYDIINQNQDGFRPGLSYRDNYNFFAMPDKMSGQINVSLTLSSHRNFYIHVKSNHIATQNH